jgi:hypothetical protein
MTLRAAGGSAQVVRRTLTITVPLVAPAHRPAPILPLVSAGGRS